MWLRKILRSRKTKERETEKIDIIRRQMLVEAELRQVEASVALKRKKNGR